ncbi:31288_t:CDS:2 [Gigaspora margarita]|uniref:31288_t:CDS:1 n=1 Tax=Gigaspora margarita TaxID=4874 RepID=A0ABN7VJY1_GIGMA|nr:31288_t:CDS:2 [Gigaspora margarita]
MKKVLFNELYYQIIWFLVGIVLLVDVSCASFNPSSYKSIEDCVGATGVSVISKNDPGYNDARVGERVRFQQYPRMITYPTNTTQVQQLVLCSNTFKITPSPRNGGHSNTGTSSLNDSLVIDISNLNSVDIDTVSQTAIVGGGIRLGPLYIQLAQKNFTFISGICPTTGLTGVISSGGFGLQSRKYGTTGDLVLGAQIVMADGSILITNSIINADLFWAIRGGGATYGIITQWKLQLIPAWQTVSVFTIEYPYDPNLFSSVLKSFTNFGHIAPDDLSTTLFITNTNFKIVGHYLGNDDQIYEKLSNASLLTYNGSPIKGCDRESIEQNFLLRCDHLGARAYFLDPNKTCTRYDYLNIGTSPYASNSFTYTIQNVTYPPAATAPGVVTQGILSVYPPGPLQAREDVKTKSMYFDGPFNDTAINVIIGLLKQMPSGSFAELLSYGGLLPTQSTNLTAFFHRNVAYHLLIQAPSTSDPTTNAWINQWDSNVRPFSNGQSYQGFEDPDLPNFPQQYFGNNLQRLQNIKSKYDPQQLFSSKSTLNTTPSNQQTSSLFGQCPFVHDEAVPARRSSGNKMFNLIIWDKIMFNLWVIAIFLIW